METPHCAVIGCGSHAQWFLVSERAGEPVEQYLCHQHWRQMMADPSHKVIRWARATSAEREED